MLKVVVLPAPFGPSSPTISPAATVIEMPLTTRRWRYSLTSFSVRNSAPSDAPDAPFAGESVFAASCCTSLIESQLRLSGNVSQRFERQLDFVWRRGGERVVGLVPDQRVRVGDGDLWSF